MKKLVLLGFAAALAVSLGMASGARQADAGDEAPQCTEKLDTELLKAACGKGGFKDAKAAMTAFVTAVKKKEKTTNKDFKLACLDCHKDTKKYVLKDRDKALADFQKYQANLGDEYTNLVKKYTK